MKIDNKTAVEWFNNLSPYHREKIRVKYSLKSIDVKITDELLGEIYYNETFGDRK